MVHHDNIRGYVNRPSFPEQQTLPPDYEIKKRWTRLMDIQAEALRVKFDENETQEERHLAEDVLGQVNNELAKLQAQGGGF